MSGSNGCVIRPDINHDEYDVYYEVHPPNYRDEARVIIHAVKKLEAEDTTTRIAVNEIAGQAEPETDLYPGLVTQVEVVLTNPLNHQYPWGMPSIGAELSNAPAYAAFHDPLSGFPVIGQVDSDGLALSNAAELLPPWDPVAGDDSHRLLASATLHVLEEATVGESLALCTTASIDAPSAWIGASQTVSVCAAFEIGPGPEPTQAADWRVALPLIAKAS